MEKYRLVKKIGQGSFGDVWLVKSSKTHKQYVLKLINLQHVSKREQQNAHLEVKLLSTLKHPNIVSYLDSFYNSKGSLFIVMGYCENGDLYTYIRNQNGIYLPQKQIIEWLMQICMALKYLHNKKILHRDLKTQNIFLIRSNLVKVGNIGIAGALNQTTDMTPTVTGIPYHMSPEIFFNKPYSFKSDVWALGCCIYEIATLKHGFSAGNIAIMKEFLHKKVPGMHQQYSQEFHDIVYSMLNIDPAKRPSVTDILLNPYVRSHIVTFLEEKKSSARSLSIKSPNSRSCRDGSSMSHEIDHEVTKENEIVPDTFISKECVFQTPDINGNGDGNDNSQQRYAVNNEKISMNDVRELGSKVVLQSLPLLQTNSSDAQSTECTSSTCSLMVIKESKAANYSDSSKMETSNFSARKAQKSAQKNGLTSLNFLRNLTCTLNRMSGHHLSSNCKKTDDYHSTFWSSDNLPAISAHFHYLIQSNTQFGCDHLKNKRFKSSEQFHYVSGGKSKMNSAGSLLNEVQLIDDSEQKENIVCPKISSGSERNCHQTLYRRSRIPIFNVITQKEIKDFHKNRTTQCYDSLLPKISQQYASMLKSNNEDCSAVSNHIDGSLLRKIINCNIKASTMPGHLSSAARQRQRERESRKLKTLSPDIVSLEAKIMKDNMDIEAAEV